MAAAKHGDDFCCIKIERTEMRVAALEVWKDDFIDASKEATRLFWVKMGFALTMSGIITGMIIKFMP